MDEEMRAAIRWLNSLEGRRWSQEKFRQGAYMHNWVSLKPDDERTSGDHMNDVITIHHGSVDSAGRYRKPRGIVHGGLWRA